MSLPAPGAPRSRVLVIEDDPDVRDALGLTLERAGLQPLRAATAREGLRTLADERPDALILDLGLPDIDGWQVLERIRQVSDIPVLVLTARSLELDKVRGLQAGADDYLTKPFGNQELVARLHALLRRSRPAPPPEEVVRDERLNLEVDVAGHRVAVDGAEVELTPVEWRLLVALARHRGTILSREQLLELAWGDPSHVGPERVKFAVLRLRRKLGPAGDLIENVRGFGYRLA